MNGKHYKVKMKTIAVFCIFMLLFGMSNAYAEQPTDIDDIPEDSLVSDIADMDVNDTEAEEPTDTDSAPEDFLISDIADVDVDDMEADGESAISGGISTMSIANPTKAYLKVTSYSYGIPDPNTGYVYETVSANTNVWVVEKSYCSSNGKYYYYAGYSYNGASHRGYFSEDNVYVGTSRLLPSQVSDETNPIGLKIFTSTPDTVYDGPDTTYSVTGSVNSEEIQLIRTEGNYNFIQYKVDSNGKYKRGFLHYQKINTTTWKNLSARYKDNLDNQTFYLRNTKTGMYLSTYQNIHNERMRQYSFSGELGTIYKFHYNSATKDYTILPVTGYANYKNNGNDRVLTIRLLAGNEHPDRNLLYYNANASKPAYQRFWVAGTGNARQYKIVPVSSYGTMTLANRPDSSNYYVNQNYTTPGNSNADDVWRFEDTTITVNTTHYGKNYNNDSLLCWAYAAKTAAKAEGSLANDSIVDGVRAVKGGYINIGGSADEEARISDWFYCNDQYAGNYTGVSYKFLRPSDMVHSFYKGHPVQIISATRAGIAREGAHSVTTVYSEWVDRENNSSNPGDYLIGFYCSDSGSQMKYTYYNWLITFMTYTVMTEESIWRDTIYWTKCNYTPLNMNTILT